jgi:hypothetical protein
MDFGAKVARLEWSCRPHCLSEGTRDRVVTTMTMTRVIGFAFLEKMKEYLTGTAGNELTTCSEKGIARIHTICVIHNVATSKAIRLIREDVIYEL